jgi:CRISPR/Cas system-associated exonuclease Cas4 (RecB family)
MAPGAGLSMNASTRRVDEARHEKSFRIVEAASAAARLEAAASFLRQFPADQPITIVGATRGAADDLARRIAVERGATIGLARYSLTQIAARVAVARLAGQGIAAATPLGAEAVAARAAFDASRGGALTYLARVAATPGFPRALAQTLGELRVAGITLEAVRHAGDAGADLMLLLARVDEEFVEAASADRARLFSIAAAAVADLAELRAPLLLLDVALDSPAEVQFVCALCGVAGAILCTVPSHDRNARNVLERAGGIVECISEPSSSGLEQLRACLFSDETPPERDEDATLRFFSAPGEGREAVEIARRILEEARRGVPFDDIAILVRTPHHYHGLFEHALHRADIPAWFDRGTRRPHPAGRAFLALLACAVEGLSARRFAEYLSLGQIPVLGSDPGDGHHPSLTPTNEVFAGFRTDAIPDEPAGEARSLPAPRRWERLIVDASVVGGDPARWARRLDGLAAQFTRQLEEVRRDDPESARALGIERDLARLSELRAFALPLITQMAAWPQSATWGVWLRALEALAPRVLNTPTYVMRILADLRPMATVGPVALAEVRSVLSERLRLVESEPPPRRYGRVLVTSPGHARGRAFRVVFLPGLAERMFPQKLRQDPLLLDGAREQLNADPQDPRRNAEGLRRTPLPTRAERGRRERLLLHLAVGAASERLYVSYPRLEIAEGRARVPSFYALDVLRGATGRIPDHETLARGAAEAGDPSLAWPAPADPDRAIDDQEHDLSVLRTLLDAGDPATVRGHAQYILKQNPALRRSVTDRWARAEKTWSHFDGLTRVNERTRDALASHRLGARPYSLSALQRFAACPYQFLLGAIYRLQPAEQPHPLQRLDPLTKGSLVHRMQASFFRELEDRGALPVTRASVESALIVLDEVMAKVADEYREQLVPAIERVWREEVGAIARDLRGWARSVSSGVEGWVPRFFEFSFGLLIDEERDPRSVRDAVTIDNRFTLRGSIDLVEEHSQDGSLRVTDHKTGKDRTRPPLVIGGGAVLQPVLYSLVMEQVTGKRVVESRLSFCTAAGGYKEQPVKLDVASRRMGIEALEIVDRAIERGNLAAAPAEGACVWCDFRPVCGPNEEERVGRKPKERLSDLTELRSRP